MYYSVMTMTVTLILYSCSLKEKQDDRYAELSTWQAQNVLSVSAKRACSRDVWIIDMELVRTRFHRRMTFRRNRRCVCTAIALLLHSVHKLLESKYF
jgi:hypothetical protein